MNWRSLCIALSFSMVGNLPPGSVQAAEPTEVHRGSASYDVMDRRLTRPHQGRDAAAAFQPAADTYTATQLTTCLSPAAFAKLPVLPAPRDCGFNCAAITALPDAGMPLGPMSAPAPSAFGFDQTGANQTTPADPLLPANAWDRGVGFQLANRHPAILQPPDSKSFHDTLSEAAMHSQLGKGAAPTIAKTPDVISGSTVTQGVNYGPHTLDWSSTIAGTLEQAKKQHKLAIWLQMLGQLDGKT